MAGRLPPRPPILKEEKLTTDIQIFKNEQFGQIRTLVENDKVLFCGSDIARALG